jgi:hypothetical protein
MNLEYSSLLPKDFSSDSRVWIYQSNRLFSIGETLEIEELLKDFTYTWMSHGIPVKGYGSMFFGQFIILMADEEATGVSGCSTDSSVRLMKEIENRYSVTLFERTSLAFVVKDKVLLIPLSQLSYALQNQFIHPDTLYFNNIVQTKKEMEDNWIISVRESWLAKRIPELANAKSGIGNNLI